MTDVTLVLGEDWEGLYVDGVLKTEGHTLRVHDILIGLGFKYDSVEPNEDWLGFHGFLPELLTDVKIGDN